MKRGKFWAGTLECLPGVHVGQIVFCAMVLASGPSTAQSVRPDCDWPHGGRTAVDYLGDKNQYLGVERVHFTPQVEELIKGQTSQNIGADIAYLLGRVPNHHRALLSLARLAERVKSDSIEGTAGKVDCYFQRALRFRPNDNTVRLIFATFLGKTSREQEASQQLETAAAAANDNPFTHYNIGLVYFDLKNYDRALTQARIAYKLGFGLPNLRDQLKSVGRWPEQSESSANGEMSGTVAAPAPSK